MSKFVSRFFKDESGATAIEYGLIATFIAVGIITVLGFVGDDLIAMFEDVRTGLQVRK